MRVRSFPAASQQITCKSKSIMMEDFHDCWNFLSRCANRSRSLPSHSIDRVWCFEASGSLHNQSKNNQKFSIPFFLIAVSTNHVYDRCLSRTPESLMMWSQEQYSVWMMWIITMIICMASSHNKPSPGLKTPLTATSYSEVPQIWV